MARASGLKSTAQKRELVLNSIVHKYLPVFSTCFPFGSWPLFRSALEDSSITRLSRRLCGGVIRTRYQVEMSPLVLANPSFFSYSLSLVPQFPQNFIAVTVLPHLGHWIRGGGYKARPQCPQNLKSSAFLPPQLRQTITVRAILLLGAIAWNM